MLMSAFPLEELTIAAVRSGFAAGRFTSVSLTQAFLARIAVYEPFYNAFTFMNPEALAAAAAADARRARGEPRGPLDGVPVVVKEAMDMVGFPSTIGWRQLYSGAGGVDLMPERDAPVVARLRAAGAVILGRTNIPAFSHDGARANSSWDGPTFNAVNPATCPGGSSAGTATAVSGNFCIVGLAEETGGSIQNPAAAQSLVSVKPTFALVPNSGVAPLAGSTRDVVGPHARTARDAALLLDVLAGYSVEDPKTVAGIGKRPPGGYAAGLDAASLAGARIGLYGPGWRDQPLCKQTSALYAAALAELKAAGAALIADPFAGSGFAELADITGKFDNRGLESMAWDMETFLRRLGPGAAAHNLAELKALVPDPFADPKLLGEHPPVRPVLARSLADPATPPDLSAFVAVREAYLAVFDRVMAEARLDALAFPQSWAEPPGVFDTEEYPATTVSEINIAGLPGVTVPAGRYASGAPFSLILVGSMWREGRLLALAHAYEQATHHRIVPALRAAPLA